MTGSGSPRTCPQCGTALAGAAVVEEFCSACLLSLALSQDAIPTEAISDPARKTTGRGTRPGRRPRTLSPIGTGDVAPARAMPAEVLRQAARRLRLAAVGTALGFALSIVVNNLIEALGWHVYSHLALGGRIFNGIVANSILPGGGDDDNLTVGAVNLTDSFGGATTVSFTVSPMGGDVGGAPTADPQSPAALFSDYIFNNSAGNHAGESPFQISGLGAAPFVDLYFYHTFQTGWRVTIPGVNETAFPGQGIFTSANTYSFKRVPVTDGAVTGTFGSGTAVICGLSVVSPLPQPFLSRLIAFRLFE